MEAITRTGMRPLLDLQRVDSTVDRLEQRRSDLPQQRELDELLERRAEIAAQHLEKQVALDQMVREQNKLEADISMIDEKVAHEQSRLYGGEISNPKELSSIQAELDALRRRKSHLEDQELDVMEQRETLEAETAVLEKSLADLDAGVAETSARCDAASVEIERELARLGDERAALVPQLPAEVIETYEEMRAKRGGVAVGALEDRTCRACGLPQSPAAWDAIKRSDDPFIRCENCRRLLVIP